MVARGRAVAATDFVYLSMPLFHRSSAKDVFLREISTVLSSAREIFTFFRDVLSLFFLLLLLLLLDGRVSSPPPHELHRAR